MMWSIGAQMALYNTQSHEVGAELEAIPRRRCGPQKGYVAPQHANPDRRAENAPASKDSGGLGATRAVRLLSAAGLPYLLIQAPP